jgi:hypothetical protein
MAISDLALDLRGWASLILDMRMHFPSRWLDSGELRNTALDPTGLKTGV